MMLVVLLLTPSWLVCSAEEPGAEEEELAELLSLLEQETEIATKTRMNSDFVPGIVTVLIGEELEKMGKTTVWDALSLVPGVQNVLDAAGNTTLVVRGIDFPFNNGNVKVMVNGVSLSREAAGVSGAVLFMPIEQVERIEFIRGPGSVLYGDFAFQGLVNIVTRSSQSAFVRANSDEGLTGGVTLAHEASGPAKFSLNVATTKSDDARIPAPRTADSDRTFGFARFSYGNFSITGEVVDSKLEISRPPNPGPGPGPPQTFPPLHRAWVAESHWKKELDDLSIDAWLMAFDDHLESGLSTFEDHGERLGLDLSWDGWNRHSLLTRLEYQSTSIDHAAQTFGAPPGVPPRVVELDDINRASYSFVLQDQIEIGDRVSATVGARFDDYDDIGSRTTPRLSVVWRATDSHIFKAQYAEGFRAPTFFELFGRGELIRDLTFEVNSTTEINYVFRRPGMVGRVTVFRSTIDDMIFVSQEGFSNANEARAEGVELEWDQQLSRTMRVIAGLSWVDAEDDRVLGPVRALRDTPSAAPWLFDVAVIAQPFRDTTVSFHWNWVADRPEPEGATSFGLLDLTFSRDRFLHENLSFRAGIENALDTSVLYIQPSPQGAFLLDYEYRTAWAQLSWEW